MNSPEVQFKFSGFQKQFFIDETPFYPRIVSTGSEKTGNVTVIPLEATLQSNLDWSQQEREALEAVAKGQKLLWKLDFGFFKNLPLPLHDEGQYLSLSFSLEHFKKTLWEKFQEQTFGVLLYEGSLDFSRQFPWDIEERERLLEWLHEDIETPFLRSLYCLKRGMEYLTLFASCLPEGVVPFVFLCDSPHFSLGEFLQLTSRENFPHFYLGIESHLFSRPLKALPLLEKIEGIYQIEMGQEHIEWGLCLPSVEVRNPALWKRVAEVIQKLDSPFRLLSEPLLTEEWDGINDLIVFSQGVTSQGRRKLLGFCAAGGRVIVDGPTLSLPEESVLERVEMA